MGSKSKAGAVGLFAAALFVYFFLYGNNIGGNINTIKFLFFGIHPGNTGCSVAAGDCPPGFVEGVTQGLMIDFFWLSLAISLVIVGIKLWRRE